MDRILFIGNSFTYFNDMPSIFSALCDGAGIPVQVESVVKGGWYLSRYADPDNEMHPAILEAAKQEWDYVILQDQSLNPAVNKEDFLAAARKLASMFTCRKKLVFYQTWAYEEGSDRLKSLMGYSCQADMFKDVKEAYNKAKSLISADKIIKSGELFQLLIKEGISPVHRDTFHASYGIGRYALALLWYKQLTGNDVIDNAFSDFDEEICKCDIQNIKECVMKI